jgi:hypothetical protein
MAVRRGLGHVPKPSNNHDHVHKEYKETKWRLAGLSKGDGFVALN